MKMSFIPIYRIGGRQIRYKTNQSINSDRSMLLKDIEMIPEYLISRVKMIVSEESD